MVNKLKISAVLLMLMTLSACASVKVTPDFLNPIKTVAVLPVYNATTDKDGPTTMRDMITYRLRQYQYTVKNEGRVDDDLVGVPAGTLMDLSHAKELGKRLGVDGLLYGYLLNYDVVIEGAYKVRRVRAGFILVDVSTGKAVWSHGVGIKSEHEGTFTGIPLAKLADDPEGMRQFESLSAISKIRDIETWKSLTGNKRTTIAGRITGNDGISATAWGAELAMESMELMNHIAADLPAGPGK